jgi:hypothetical protein
LRLGAHRRCGGRAAGVRPPHATDAVATDRTTMPNASSPWLTGIDTIDPTYYTPGMAMGRRKDRARTPGLWIAANELPPTSGHPFYQRLNQVLDAHAFDDFVEAQCAPRLIDLETHRAVFTWILQVLATADLIKGKTIGIDSTTLEANAALRSIVRRDSGETYHEFLTRLAQASGIETPTRADLARVDRKRKKKGSNDDWTHPHDPDAKITKMKDGRTHLAHKAEQAVDLETGAIVGVRSGTPKCAMPCIAIVVAFAAHAVNGYCASAASVWNDPSRISTRRVGCAGCISAGTRTFGSGC